MPWSRFLRSRWLVVTATAYLLVLASATRGRPSTCSGDCDSDGTVTVDELLTGVGIALGHVSLDECSVFDSDGDRQVTIDELLTAVNAALRGCPTPGPSDTPTASPVHIPTPTPTGALIQITAPTHGSFAVDRTLVVSGRVASPVAGRVVTLNGIAVAVDVANTFSTTVALDSEAIFNPLVADLVAPDAGVVARDRVVVIAGDSIDEGTFSPRSVALRVNDSGLAKAAPALPGLADIDLNTLIPPRTKLISRYCVIDSIFGCLQRVDVTARSSSFDSFTLDPDSMPDFVAADITITNLRFAVNIDGGPIDCNADIVASRVTIVGSYDLIPSATNPNRVDVNQIGDVAVGLTNFDHEFTSGICDASLLGNLVRALIGNIEPTVRDSLVQYLRDPDGAGPQDSVVARALQTALTGIEVAGPIGAAAEIDIDSPLVSITEDVDGVTLAADSRVATSRPAPDAPRLRAAYHVDATVPALGPLTPVGNLPYDLGLGISTSAFNQLLKASIESGRMAADLTAIDLGAGPTPITASVLAQLIPEFASFDPDLPMTIRVRPTIAPIVTGTIGPRGELAELHMSHLLIEVRSRLADKETTLIKLATDLSTGLDLEFDDSTSQLVFEITPPLARDITVVILANAVETNEARLQAALPAILSELFANLSSELGGFPIPDFLGLQSRGVEISRSGEFVLVDLDLQESSPLRR